MFNPLTTKAMVTSGDKNKQEIRHAYRLTPSRLEKMVYEGISTCCDGCRVEPDGMCPHGYRSPLLVLGLI